MSDQTTDWDWRDIDRCVRDMHGNRQNLGRCARLARVPAEPPFERRALLELGITGVEFAAFRTEHPGGIAADRIRLRSPVESTVPGPIYRVDDGAFFTELDIRKPLPFAADSVQWVYAEHLIEHVSPHNAVFWLKEVARILVPGGVLRLSTPDLARYIEGYATGNGFLEEHRDRAIPLLAPAPPMPGRRAFMINQIFYLYGHRWIYDVEELCDVLQAAGFAPAELHRCAFRQGRRPDVAALDREARSDESVYIEARC